MGSWVNAWIRSSRESLGGIINLKSDQFSPKWSCSLPTYSAFYNYYISNRSRENSKSVVKKKGRVQSYKQCKRSAVGVDEGDDDHQQLYTYDTHKRLKIMWFQTPAN